jgi:hypothetical protein
MPMAVLLWKREYCSESLAFKRFGKKFECSIDNNSNSSSLKDETTKNDRRKGQGSSRSFIHNCTTRKETKMKNNVK